MPRHIGGHLLDAIPPFEEVFKIDRTVEDLVQFLDVGDPLRLDQREKFPLHHLMRHQHLVRRQVVVQRQCRPVLNALGHRILVEITLVVFAAECLEGPSAVSRFVDGCTSESEVGGVRQSGHQIVAEVAAGRPMRLVDQHENIRPCVEVRRHIAELVDRGHDEAPIVLFEEPV